MRDPVEFNRMMHAMATATFRAAEAINEMKLGVIRLHEVSMVSTAKVLFVDDVGHQVSSLEELYTWALATGRPNLASLLDEAPTHITHLFHQED